MSYREGTTAKTVPGTNIGKTGKTNAALTVVKLLGGLGVLAVDGVPGWGRVEIRKSIGRRDDLPWYPSA